MRSVAVILLSSLALVMLAHAHCLAEICPGDNGVASIGISDAPADDPICESETVCPAKDDFRRMDSPALPTLTESLVVDLGLASPVAPRLQVIGHDPGLIPLSHQPSILTLNQIFRI